MASRAKGFSVIVIGTGFSGVCAGIQLKKAGFNDFVILEKDGAVGGCWRDNHYPGIACDIKSNFYSYSFEPYPGWTRTFAPGPEILQYTKHCIKKYDLEDHIKLNWEVTSAKYDETKRVWTVVNQDNETITANVVISGTGPLHIPSLPDIEGIEDFKGQVFHSARWNDEYNLNGKNVCVIGTGASAIQIVPAIQPLLNKLYLMQRTAPWVLPKDDRAFSPFEKFVFKQLPFIQKLNRNKIFLMHELQVYSSLHIKSLMKAAERRCLRQIKKSIKDPVLVKKVTPGFSIGCKRILLSNDWYSTLAQPNVDVVTDNIARFTKNSVITSDGQERKIDALILCTGFHVADAFKYFNIKGRNGLSMADAWDQDGPSAYYGVAVHNYPNFFTILGPNSGLGASSMLYMIEAQVNYIVDGIIKMKSKNLKSLEIKEDVQDRFNKKLTAKINKSVWANGGCNSWYLYNGNKRSPVVWPDLPSTFKKKLAKGVNLKDFIVGK